ncbi:virulence protein RhuM/Fic/DOC family protein [Leptospirillum ferrooxidans]|uniref:Deathoncuring family protein n=1 Tax=Leptospirillum ferrooxidans (strain C2-3) TaxID=1162668 RepID=I0IRR6_LEPFC|nr:virulence protein RhuM/Fic/DOC family protein [Leptospirillum ferrooxidans]BAM07965.1 deathoncuring family protein [Leptospirillum ferrooxidans C2-3]
MKDVVIYQSDRGSIEVTVDRDNVWLSQKQMSLLFDTSPDNIGLHLKKIYSEGELDEEATTEESSVVRLEGRRHVTRQIKHYNLDAIISVGYRVNSKKGVQFRQWSTGVLKKHLLQGYTLNQKRFEDNARELEKALLLIRKTAESPALSTESGKGLLDVVTRYTRTFLWLERYDEGLLSEPSGQEGGVLPTPEEARQSIALLKGELIKRGEAGNLFGQERGDGFLSILGNLEQSVFGQPAYPTVEARAAHLLYFVIKNHPFSDGNKRSAALLFLDFLNRNGRLIKEDGTPVVNDVGLAALALLVAESDPKDKDVLIHLIMNMLAECVA